jgi:peptide deformylase
MSVDPAHLHLRIYPDPILRDKAQEIDEVTDDVRRVGARLVELMHESEGIGLAAPQAGLDWRMFVAFVPPHPEDPPLEEGDPLVAMNEPQVYINPVIIAHEGDLEPYEEGCLSLPEIRGEVRRPPIIEIEATNLEGERFRETCAGLLARCLQHELDHLDGVLIIDRMTPMSRLKNRSRVKDLEKQAAML